MVLSRLRPLLLLPLLLGQVLVQEAVEEPRELDDEEGEAEKKQGDKTSHQQPDPDLGGLGQMGCHDLIHPNPDQSRLEGRLQPNSL